MVLVYDLIVYLGGKMIGVEDGDPAKSLKFAGFKSQPEISGLDFVPLPR